MLKIYCEHGALTKGLKAMRNQGLIELVHFPYDPDSTVPHSVIGVPSAAMIGDLNLTFDELPGVFADYTGSQHYSRIAEIVGIQNRRDILHLDSAVKSGCIAICTNDRDILDHRDALEAALPLRVFHPSRRPSAGGADCRCARELLTSISGDRVLPLELDLSGIQG